MAPSLVDRYESLAGSAPRFPMQSVAWLATLAGDFVFPVCAGVSSCSSSALGEVALVTLVWLLVEFRHAAAPLAGFDRRRRVSALSYRFEPILLSRRGARGIADYRGPTASRTSVGERENAVQTRAAAPIEWEREFKKPPTVRSSSDSGSSRLAIVA